MHAGIARYALSLFALALLGSPTAGTAQAPSASSSSGSFLGLGQAIDRALHHHPSIQEASAYLKAFEARTEQTRSMYYPQVYANANTVAGAGRTNPRFLIGGALLQENQTTFAGGVIANQRIYDFGYTGHLVDSAQLAERAQGHDVNARHALVIVQVQRAYLTSLKRRRLVQIAEETVRERGLIAGQIETLYRQQLKSKLDYDLARLEQVNAESFLIRSRNDLKGSFADLNRAMGIAGQEEYVLEDLLIEVRATPARRPDQRQLVASRTATVQGANRVCRSQGGRHQTSIHAHYFRHRQWGRLRTLRPTAGSTNRGLVDGRCVGLHAAFHGVHD